MAISCSGSAFRLWPFNLAMFHLVDDIKSEDTRSSISDSDEDSDPECEDKSEVPGTMLDLDSTNVPLDPRTAPETPDSMFKPYNQGCLHAAEIKDSIFKLLKEPLKKSKSPTKGCIYALSIENYPGYIKIGRTRISIASRRKSIEKCVSYNLRVYNVNDSCRVQHYQRLERLIHEELQNERRTFACHCRKKTTDSDCSMFHGEWFAVSEVEASKVINRWRKWMCSNPYTGGILRPAEQLKIDYLNGLAAQVHFQWSDFVDFPWWKLQWIWLYNELHGPRPENSTCSRWDSLCKHWKSNFLFYLSTLIFSHALFITTAMLPPALISIRYLAFANSIFLGGSAIYYAA